MNENFYEERKLKESIEKIIDIYQKNKNIEDILDDNIEKQVLEKWSKIFNINYIDKINENNIDEVLKFFDFEENHHWDHINRHKKDIKSNLKDFKEKLKILLDENKPVGERLNEFINKVYGMSISTTTPILLVSNPEKYGVWNGPSEKALKKLGLWKDEWDKEKNNENYTIYNEINNLLIKLRDLVKEKIPEENFDLWKLDSVLGIIERENKKTKNKENEEESETNQIRWWVEKTYEKSHNIHTEDNFDYSLGKALWSPQKSRDGKKIYENMKKIKEGDKIIHLVMDKDNLFIGVSNVVSKVEKFEIPPLKDSKENGPRPGYRIKLDGYQDISSVELNWEKLKNSEGENLKRIANEEKDLFYKKDLQLNQGKYITLAPERLVEIINTEYKKVQKNNLPYYNQIKSNTDEGLNTKIKEFFDNLDELLEKKKQIIFYGPAGTGKTYFAINYAKNKENHEDHYKIITFHQSFSYEEFIEGIKPVVSNNSINYKVKDGIFKRCNFLAILLALKANKDKISSFMNSNDLEDLINYLKNDETINEEIEKRYDDFKKEVWKYIYKLNNENKLKDIFNAPGIPKVILIIDEINRGNISKIFGELITLIENDKRLGAENMILLNLPYSNEPFSIAPNLYIIGTMNTSDKSIALIDTALRRRFYFWEMKPDYDEINKDIGGINLRDLLKNLNEKIEEELDKDHVLGHSYFMLEEDSIEALYNTWYREIIPHLEEMFYGNYEKISDVLGRNFYEKNDNKGIYQLKTFKKNEFLSEFNKEDFIEALKKIAKPNDGK